MDKNVNKTNNRNSLTQMLTSMTNGRLTIASRALAFAARTGLSPDILITCPPDVYDIRVVSTRRNCKFKDFIFEIFA